MNLRAGAKFDAWTVNLFVNNVADKRGILYGGLGAANPAAYFYIQHVSPDYRLPVNF